MKLDFEVTDVQRAVLVVRKDCLIPWGHAGPPATEHHAGCDINRT